MRTPSRTSLLLIGVLLSLAVFTAIAELRTNGALESQKRQGPPAQNGVLSPLPEATSQDTYLLSEGRALRRVEQRFQLVNHSDSGLAVKVVKTSCTCTEARLPSPFIGPGGSQSLVVLMAAPSESGRRTATVDVEYDGNTKGRIVVSPSVTFLDDVWVEPDSLRFDVADDNERRVVKVHARRRSNSNALPPALACDSSPSWVQCYIPATSARHQTIGNFEEFTWSVPVRFDSKADATREGGQFGRLLIRVGQLGAAEVPCWGDFRLGVVVAPTRAMVPAIRVGETTSRQFVLRASDSQPFDVLSISCSDPDVELVSKSTNATNVSIVEARINPSRVGEHSYPLVFHTSHPSSAKVTATITARVID